MDAHEVRQQIVDLERHAAELQAVVGDLAWRQGLVAPGSAGQARLRAKLGQIQRDQAAVRAALVRVQRQWIQLLMAQGSA